MKCLRVADSDTLCANNERRQFPLTMEARLRLHVCVWGGASCHLWAGLPSPGPTKSNPLSSSLYINDGFREPIFAQQRLYELRRRSAGGSIFLLERGFGL